MCKTLYEVPSSHDLIYCAKRLSKVVLMREPKLREEKSFSPSQVANKNQKGGLTPAVSDFSKALNYLGLWAS